MTHTQGTWKREGQEIVGQRSYDEENAKLQAEQDANARLIAAAPELLEALQVVTDELEIWLENDNMVSSANENVVKARAAIQKATTP